MLEVSTEQGLLSAAQWNVVELHTQNANASSYEKPNRMIFDLDPGENVTWAQVQEGALLLRALLDHLGLPAFLKTSGGKGLHVVVPVKRATAGTTSRRSRRRSWRTWRTISRSASC